MIAKETVDSSSYRIPRFGGSFFTGERGDGAA
jgi:hypothetical protein